MGAGVKYIFRVTSTHFKFANSTIHCSVQGTVELHSERVSVLSFRPDSVDDCLELCDVVLNQFCTILDRVHHRLDNTEKTERRVA